MADIRLVVFDMAGTTVDEDNIVYKTVQKVINEQGFNLNLDQVLEFGAGKEKHKAITDILTACTTAENISEIADKAFANFKPTLEHNYNTIPVKSFDGMESFFAKLKDNGINVVLNTGYDSKTANQLLGKLGWSVGNEIDALITASDVVLGRPHPDMITKAMEMFNITDPKQVLKAGDSEIDVIEGKNANCGITVGVLSGAQTRAQIEIANPDYILDKLTDLEAILLAPELA